MLLNPDSQRTSACDKQNIASSGMGSFRKDFLQRDDVSRLCLAYVKTLEEKSIDWCCEPALDATECDANPVMELPTELPLNGYHELLKGLLMQLQMSTSLRFSK